MKRMRDMRRRNRRKVTLGAFESLSVLFLSWVHRVRTAEMIRNHVASMSHLVTALTEIEEIYLRGNQVSIGNGAVGRVVRSILGRHGSVRGRNGLRLIMEVRTSSTGGIRIRIDMVLLLLLLP